MRKLIINADDFAMTDGICRAICELLDENAISSTTLMMAYPGAEERMRRFAVHELCGYAGIHLQLTEGRAVSPTADVPSLVDGNGAFRDPRQVTVDTDHVLTEWRRQIEIGADLLKGRPTHIDSHHGVHRRPEFVSVYLQLAKEFGLPFRGGPGPIAEAIARDALPGTRVVINQWTGTGESAAELGRRLEDTANEDPYEYPIELVIHPGYSDEALRRASTLADRREDDLNGLRDFAEFERDVGFVLVQDPYPFDCV